MITLQYWFRSAMEARGFAFLIRNKKNRYHSKGLRYPNTTVFRKGNKVSISHDETKEPKFFEVCSKPDYHHRVKFHEEITNIAKRYHGYYYEGNVGVAGEI